MAGFTAMERAQLCGFFAVQCVRTKNYLERYKSLNGSELALRHKEQARVAQR